MKKSRNKESDLFYNPISIKGAKKHNLKNIDVDIPRNKLVVLTGVSGSGKSSLAFNTLFNEGQKKYAESLNTYVRQFISKMESAEVDSITGLCPTIAIEQKQSSANARSTVGTLTEINDYLRLLFAKLGKIKSPVSGKIIQKYTSEKIISEIEKMHPHQWLYILQPIIAKKISDLEIKIEQLNSEGFKIYIVDDKENRILNPVSQISYNLKWKYFVILERFKTKSSYEDGELSGLFETLEFCFLGSSNDVWIDIDQKELKYYPNHLFQDGIQFEEPNINIFSFNNSYGFCKTCLARGWQYGVNYKFIIPNYNLSISTGALKIWNIKNKHVEQWKENFLNQANIINFPLDKAIKDFTEIEKEMLFKGSDKLIGIETFLSRIYKTSVLQYEEIISNFTGII
ncbi:MAG: hypothetical protein ORN85_03280, partial [Sediminibacterium sp.]|nr:hypothetical protein [Sediminibacterium sp.]